MANFATALRKELRRLTAGEMGESRRVLRSLQTQVEHLRRETRQQRRTIAALTRRMARVRGGATPAMKAGFSPQEIFSLRSRLEMTREQFAKFLDVSPGSIFGWEKGRTVPRGRSIEKLRRIRAQGRGAEKAPSVRRARKPVKRVLARAARKARRPAD